MKQLQSLIQYYKSHLWFQVSCVFCAAILVITVCYQLYMRNEYTDFLLEKNHLMESAVLDTMEKNLDYSLGGYINIGAQIAVNQNVYDLANRLFYIGDNPTKDFLNLKTTFSSMASYSKNILNISIVSMDGKIYQYDRLLQVTTCMWKTEDREFLKSMYGQLYRQANMTEVPKYLVSAAPDIHPTTNERVFHIFYPVVGKENKFRKMNAMLCITFKMDILQPLLDIVSEDEAPYSKGYITDETGTIIYHSAPEFIGKSEFSYLNSGSMVVLDKSLTKINWKLHISLERDEMNKNVTEIISRGMLVYIILLAGLVGIFYFIIRKITNPLNKIGSAMAATGSGEKRETVRIGGKHEIWQLAEGYNEMIEKLTLKEQEVQKNHRLALVYLERQHQAEREALEAQINAHFLCNTLGTINYEAMECGNFKVSHMIKKLSNILRYTFDQKCQNVYMYQEIVWIEQYLFLQKARFEDLFEYSIVFPDDLANWPCCKLMLQPFVENVIIHGFEDRERGGLIAISAARWGDCLRLSIKDNGCGIQESKRIRIQEVLDGKEKKSMEDIGIGIRNVVSRMHLFYGNTVKITLLSDEKEGTEFIFYIPGP